MRVETPKNLLEHVNHVVHCDVLVQLRIVLFRIRDVTGFDFTSGDSVEAVEQVFRSVAVGVTNTVPNSIVKMLRETASDKSEDVLCRWG